jgi:hypothetical protein
LVNPREREKNSRVVQTFNEERALDESGGVVALAVQILGKRRNPGIAKLIRAIERRHYSYARSVAKLEVIKLLLDGPRSHNHNYWHNPGQFSFNTSRFNSLDA